MEVVLLVVRCLSQGRSNTIGPCVIIFPHQKRPRRNFQHILNLPSRAEAFSLIDNLSQRMGITASHAAHKFIQRVRTLCAGGIVLFVLGFLLQKFIDAGAKGVELAADSNGYRHGIVREATRSTTTP